MNCVYEMNSEQEVRASQQYHAANGYTTLTSPSAATMMMMESAANNSNTMNSDSVKQSPGELLMVSTQKQVAIRSVS